MKKKVLYIIAALAVLVAALIAYRNLPTNRFGTRSELVMLGDLNEDRVWDSRDRDILRAFLDNPFNYADRMALKVDINANGLIDSEDVAVLHNLYEYSDPYVAADKAVGRPGIFPRPRDFFRYVPEFHYVQRPLYALRHAVVNSSPLTYLKEFEIGNDAGYYRTQLLREIYSEAIRFSLAYDSRKDHLSEIEKKYADEKIMHCNALYARGEYYSLILELIGLVEDAETLSVKGQSVFAGRILYFRDHLRELLTSDLYRDYTDGKQPYSAVLNRIETLLSEDLGMHIDIKGLQSPRDLTKVSNYVDRAKWQYYKSSVTEEDFLKLVLYAQNDRRYLRAVSMTTPKHSDVRLSNHNLPMVLLFRESLRIRGGDKMAAVGLLDEAIRIPFQWVKTIPRDSLPSSIALENFLLPGNKEDGSDKSRHWNVFGGISIYRTPEESLVLALKRESMDLKDSDYSVGGMTEFIRDTIANINGIYYVLTIDPATLEKYP